MFNPSSLFKQRLSAHIKLLNRYLRYIFNGHFMIALLFLIITLSIYYQQWLENISPAFPGTLIIAFAFGLAASYNPLQMFLKEPDKVFLIVKEEKMYRYFYGTLLYNYIFQLYIVIIVAAALSPMYSTIYPDKQMSSYLFMFVILLIVKAWNMLANWWMLKVQNPAIRAYDKIIRTVLSIAIFYFLLVEQFFIVICVLYFAVILNNFWLSRKQHGLAWEVLIDNDQNRLALFYRFVSMFANVPQVKKRLKNRRILAGLVNKYTSFKHKHTYDYLFRLTFFRSSDYFNMYIRLILLGGIMIAFVSNDWLRVAIAILFIYMANFQMVTLYYHYRTNIWLDLYPIREGQKETAFIRLLTTLTIIQTVIFAGMFLVLKDVPGFFLTITLGSLFNYLFNFHYVKQKITGK